MALFCILTAIPHRISTQASSHFEIHPGDLSCPALMLGHLAAPTTHPSQGTADCSAGRAESASVSAFLHCKNPFPPVALTWHKGRKGLDVPISFSSGVVLVLPTSAHSALLDLSFPIRHLSLPMKNSKLGQVLTSFLVGHRKEIKAQVKSLPHRALFTFLIVSHMPALRFWEHGFAFQSRLKNLGSTAEKNQEI